MFHKISLTLLYPRPEPRGHRGGDRDEDGGGGGQLGEDGPGAPVQARGQAHALTTLRSQHDVTIMKHNYTSIYILCGFDTSNYIPIVL